MSPKERARARMFDAMGARTALVVALRAGWERRHERSWSSDAIGRRHQSEYLRALALAIREIRALVDARLDEYLSARSG